jgi:glycine dehydrogenase
MLMSTLKPLADLETAGEFVARHIGPDASDEAAMLAAIGAPSRRALIDAVVPRAIARREPMALPPALS